MRVTTIAVFFGPVLIAILEVGIPVVEAILPISAGQCILQPESWVLVGCYKTCDGNWHCPDSAGGP